MHDFHPHLTEAIIYNTSLKTYIIKLTSVASMPDSGDDS